MAISLDYRLIFIILIFAIVNHVCDCDRSFYIDYDKNTFMKDGQPFRYVSGSIHPYRVPRDLWQDRLSKMRAGGLNVVEIYIFWNEHEKFPGVYNFDGKNDVYTFIKMAQQTDLLVILRAGPYACAEHEYGGFPWWLLSNGTQNVQPRSNETNFMNAVNRWYKAFFPGIVPLLYNNGGPVIMVQIENEYGGFSCEKSYLLELKDIFQSVLGNNVVYFTTDNNVDYCVKCGAIPGVYSTIDFGPWVNVTQAFEIQRLVAPNGPLVNSEYYTGWIDTWGTKHSRIGTDSIIKILNDIFDIGANVNFYMFHGGTNFGFSSGSVHPFLNVITSYDYDAPISEAGDTTNKYLAIRDAISKYFPLPNMTIPANSTKANYGKIPMNYYGGLVKTILDSSDDCVQTQYPKTFEELGQGYGFILYSTFLKNPDVNNKVLAIDGIRDRGYVYIGDTPIGIVQRSNITNITINLVGNKDTILYIIVENTGRMNVEPLDPKGIVMNVTLDGVILDTWVTCLTQNFIPDYQEPKNNNKLFSNMIQNYKNLGHYTNLYDNFTTSAVYIGYFTGAKEISDTFLKTDQFTKGIAFISSDPYITNLGRYWPHYGPQSTLYIPSPFISPSSDNYIVLIEFEGSACNNPDACYVELIDHPEWTLDNNNEEPSINYQAHNRL